MRLKEQGKLVIMGEQRPLAAAVNFEIRGRGPGAVYLEGEMLRVVTWVYHGRSALGETLELECLYGDECHADLGVLVTREGASPAPQFCVALGSVKSLPVDRLVLDITPGGAVKARLMLTIGPLVTLTLTSGEGGPRKHEYPVGA